MAPDPDRVQRFGAYGYVTDPDGRVLLTLIADGYPGAGRWHLPGGGTDFGESPTDCLGGYLFALLYLIPVLVADKTRAAAGCATLGLPWRGGRSRPAADSAGSDR